ncbi:MAG: substrate-binding domain-containing protein [Clostridia bacterium]|nr:substrate-binding domain-containing protein [Clostridia bacterium]
MRKYIGYIPAMLFSLYYIIMSMGGSIVLFTPILLWLLCFWASAFFIHKGFFWGAAFGMMPAIHMIFMGLKESGQVMDIEIPLGIVLILFYLGLGIFLWFKRNTLEKAGNKEVLILMLKMALSIVSAFLCFYAGILSSIILSFEGINSNIAFISAFVLPTLLFPLIWLKKRKKFIIIWLIFAIIYAILLGVNYGMIKYDEKITVNTSPNINVHEYLPFKEDSKIVKYRSETLQFTENPPKIDGAAALFPVYSAFVNATYPETTELDYGTFEYNNTPVGYRLLAEKQTDIFIGVYPSEEQKAYANEQGTTFKYTPIGSEAFVFFVHKDNPIESLTAEEIKGIYSGRITNWKEVGGKNEEIFAYQRNEGSGSQSMLKRFMGDTPIMEPPTELRNDFMAGIIEEVADYRSKSGSIGFSFRYYVEGIIKNPDIKMIAVDGAAPTEENIKNGTYPIVTPIYAVTYEEQENENVDKLLSWILSGEGQKIIEETGYVGIAE